LGTTIRRAQLHAGTTIEDIDMTSRCSEQTKTGFFTKLVHAGAPDDAYGSAVAPIYQTSTFAFKNAQEGADRFAGTAEGYIYTRLGNPTVHALETCVAELEEGVGAVATSSGMGAVLTVYMTLLGQGAHVVSSACVYGPSRGLLEDHFSRFGVTATFVDTSDVRNIEAAIRPETRFVYVETPANPSMTVTDLSAAAAVAHARGCLLVVDNTFASPYLQKPLPLGADVVLHSVTKFINGHADVVGGILAAKDPVLLRRLRSIMITTGCNMDPHQAFLVHRGLKTLALRLDRAQASAHRIAEWLEARREVAWVRYIGLPSHPQHELSKRQMSGPGAMISFELKGGFKAGERLMNRVRLAILAVSLGGVETLIEHPASMTHAKVSPAERAKAGITDGLVRYSVGIEDPEDLIEDLRQALED
jgi:methionine-gamma-lyase